MADQPHDTPGEEFSPPPDFIPSTPIPAWVTFYPGLSPQARATADFLYGHVNLNNGTFLVNPSHASIAKYLGLKKADGARRYVNELKDAGIVTTAVMFWDRKAKQRTTQRVRDDGVKNDQTSNSTQLRWTPPQGRLHPGPMNSDEWHHPKKIQERIAAETARRQAQQTPPPPHKGVGHDQEESESSQVGPHPHTKGGASPSHGGDPPLSMGDEEHQEKNTKPSQDARATKRDDSGELGVVGSGQRKKRTKRSKSTQEWVESAGADLLRSLGVAEHALADNAPIVDTALERLGAKRVHAALGDGLSGTANPAGVVLHTRIPQLQNQLKSTGEARRSSKPAWCGADGSGGEDPCDETTRLRQDQRSGASYRCPDCNPNARCEQRDDQPAESERGGVGTIGSLEDLLAG